MVEAKNLTISSGSIRDRTGKQKIRKEMIPSPQITEKRIHKSSKSTATILEALSRGA